MTPPVWPGRSRRIGLTCCMCNWWRIFAPVYEWP